MINCPVIHLTCCNHIVANHVEDVIKVYSRIHSLAVFEDAEVIENMETGCTEQDTLEDGS